jgi:hypothetical protein
MSRLKDVRTLRKIAEVRSIQRQSAEAEVARAAAATRRVEAQRAARLARLESSEQGWAALLGAPTLNLSLAAAWSAEVLDGEAELGRADANLALARDEQSQRNGAWSQAIARADNADDMARNAARRASRRREEAALAELADRVSRRMSGSRGPA